MRKLIITLLSLIFTMFLLRLFLPQYVKFVFPPLFFILAFYIVFYKKYCSTKKLFISDIKFFFLPLVLLMLYFLTFIFSTSNVGSIFYRELFNIGLVVSSFVIIFWLIRDKNDFDIFVKQFIRLSFLLGTIFVLFGILKFVLQLYNFRFNFLDVPIVGYPLGVSLAADNNFFSLACYITFLFGWCFYVKYKIKRSFIFQILLSVQFICAIHTTSRRALILGLFFLLLNVFVVFLSIIKGKKHPFLKKISIPFVPVLIGCFFLINILFLKLDNNTQNIIIGKLSLNRTELFSVFNKSIGSFFPHIVDKALSGIYDYNEMNPLDPASGWARANYKKSKISGSNSKIVPSGAVGALIDRSIDVVSSSNSSYYYSILNKEKLIKTKRYLFSVYCYVSHEFDGDDVYLSYIKGETYVYNSIYDLKNKGTWQRLSFFVYGVEDVVTSAFYVKLNNAHNFSKLNGHVIFACPEFKEIEFDSRNPITWCGNGYNRIDSLRGGDLEVLKEQNVFGVFIDKQVNASQRNGTSSFYTTLLYDQDKIIGKNRVSIYYFISPDFDGDDLFLVASRNGSWIKRTSKKDLQKGKWQKLSIEFDADTSAWLVTFWVQSAKKTFHDLKGHVIIAYPEINNGTYNLTPKQISLLFSQTKILQARLFQFNNLDSVSVNCTFSKLYENSGFIGLRVDRWRYAIYLYRYQYSFVQKMFGDRYLHTRKFASEFDINDGYEYPHNPFLSVLLYSGFFGLLSYLWFLYYVFYYYWKYRKEYWVFGLSFMASFFFAFFSANSPFDPAIVGVFSILPYFIHYYHVKDKAEKNIYYNEQIES